MSPPSCPGWPTGSTRATRSTRRSWSGWMRFGGKAYEWTDLPVDRDQLLTTVSLYWFTGSGASAAHTLYEQAHSAAWGAPPTVPQGFAIFGADETVRRLVPAP